MRFNFLILFLVCSLSSLSNKIDRLTSDSAIAHFVDTISRHSAVFPKSFLPGQLSFRYLKIDIDKNGSTDLLVNDRTVFAIVDAGQDKFELKHVGSRHNETRLIGIDTSNTQPILLIKKQNGYTKRDGPTFTDVPDSITYQFNGFIEYNSKPVPIRLGSIGISRERCFGTCPVYYLTIDSNRHASLNAQAFMKQQGLLKATIDKGSFDEIVSLLSYLNLSSLKSNYAVNATDNPTINISVQYNGISKYIRDYGLEGSLGLQQLYSLIDQLIDKQNWMQ